MKARLASGNAHKLEELRAALPGWELELLEADRDFPPEDGATYYENARAKAALRPRVGDAGRVGARRGLRDRGRGARRPARDRIGPLGRRRRRAAPRRARRRRRSARPLRLRARRARPGRRGACAAPGSSRGRSRPSGAATRASATTRSSSRPARSGRSPSSATTGSGRTPTAPAPRSRRLTARPRRPRSSSRAAVPPVHLGAEDDHVRHHVEPDEQQHRGAERLHRDDLVRDADEERQHLERRLQQHRGERSARPHLAQRQLDVRQPLVRGDEEDEHGGRRDEHREPVGDERVVDEVRGEALQQVVAERAERRAPPKRMISEPAMNSVARNLPRRNGAVRAARRRC